MVVAVDTSSLVAYLGGGQGVDVDQVDRHLDAGTILIPPIVLVEILSDPKLPQQLVNFIERIPRLEITLGYWQRSAELRAVLISKSLKAKLGDTLIAQSCIDHRVPLICRDRDFGNFGRHSDLKLLGDN